MSGAPERRWQAGGRLWGLSALGLPVAALDGGTGMGLAAVAAFDAVLLAGSALEARAAARRTPAVERTMPERLVMGQPNVVTLRFHNATARSVAVTVRDDVPAGFRAEPDELRLVLPPHARREARYTVHPSARGVFHFGDLYLRVEGSAGLGAATVRLPASREVRVYPNVLGPRRYDLASRLGDLRSVGFRSVRASGGAGEFDHLREYVLGDSYRTLDWKGTAKRGRPITRVLEQERSQQIVLLLDAGRMMAARQGDIAKLDHAINAALLLAWVALQKGDRVGLIVFADAVRAFVPPGRGMAQYRRLLEALYAVHAEPTAVDFRRLVEFLALRVPRRSLLLIFSDLLDETHAMPLAEHAPLLGRRHLPVCVTLTDAVAEARATETPGTVLGVYERAAAIDLLGEREAVKAHLRKRGVSIVESGAAELSAATVNRYLEIKARHRL